MSSTGAVENPRRPAHPPQAGSRESDAGPAKPDESPAAGIHATRRFATVVEAELGVKVEDEGDCNWLVHPPKDLIGLALSGGGIRSATFNLGVLQALNQAELLHTIDYMSTVSGGGYIGGFWNRWRSRPLSDGTLPGMGDPHFPDGDGKGGEAPEVRHLRQFSNFLSPRMGLTVDTGRMLVSGLSSAVPSILAALSVITLALLGWCILAGLLFEPLFLELSAGSIAALGVQTALLAGLTTAFLLYMEWSWVRSTGDPPIPGAYRAGMALGVSVTAIAWIFLATRWDPLQQPYPGNRYLPLVGSEQVSSDWLFLFAPSFALAAGVLSLVLLRWFISRWIRGLDRRIVRAAHDRVQMRLLMLGSIWAASAALWCAGAAIYLWIGEASAGPKVGALGTLVIAAAALFTRLQKAFAKASDSGLVRTALSKLRPLIPQALAYLTVSLTITCVVAALISLERMVSPASPPYGLLAALGTAVLVIGLVLVLLDPNEVALHSFYKSRIVRTYLGASNWRAREEQRSSGVPLAKQRPRTEEHPRDDIYLDKLTGRGRRPYHLVCCAANDQADSGEMDDLRRGASSATLSAAGLSVGADGAWSPWTRRDRAISLGSSLTASGAAFNPLMGSYSVRLGPAVTFLASALNLRLGIWVRHPDDMQRRSEANVARRAKAKRERRARFERHERTVAAEGSRAGASVRGSEAEADVGTRKLLMDMRKEARRERKRAGRKPLLIGVPFFREMFGRARAEGPLVHLSDGGHFENTGVYELVRRHCRVIVACDCGADPKYTFNDVGTLVRRVRQDFGVEIFIDLDPLRPDPTTGLARSPVVIGRIAYPKDSQPGVLVLLKPSLIGDEPSDIGQYHSRSPEFPHETTSDQFYDEAQWESYRRLGEHSAARALTAIEKRLAPGGRQALYVELEKWRALSPETGTSVDTSRLRIREGTTSPEASP